MDTWYAYRHAWSVHPWVALILLLAVAMVLGGVIGTIAGGSALAILFIPGLIVGYLHHLVAMRAAER